MASTDPQSDRFKKDLGEIVDLKPETKKVNTRLTWTLSLSLLILAFVFFQIDYTDFKPSGMFDEPIGLLTDQESAGDAYRNPAYGNPACGNGIIEVGEECDDGKQCETHRVDCTYNPSYCDGFDPVEACMQHNLDGCSDQCKTEYNTYCDCLEGYDNQGNLIPFLRCDFDDPDIPTVTEYKNQWESCVEVDYEDLEWPIGLPLQHICYHELDYGKQPPEGVCMIVKCENCVNGVDDENDGKVDCMDPDCMGKEPECCYDEELTINTLQQNCPSLLSCNDGGCKAITENVNVPDPTIKFEDITSCGLARRSAEEIVFKKYFCPSICDTPCSILAHEISHFHQRWLEDNLGAHDSSCERLLEEIQVDRGALIDCISIKAQVDADAHPYCSPHGSDFSCTFITLGSFCQRFKDHCGCFSSTANDLCSQDPPNVDIGYDDCSCVYINGYCSEYVGCCYGKCESGICVTLDVGEQCYWDDDCTSGSCVWSSGPGHLPGNSVYKCAEVT